MAGMLSPIGPYPGADGLRDPIFKGCTRPAMLAGVPMTWLLLSAGAALIAAPYLLYFVQDGRRPLLGVAVNDAGKPSATF